MTYFMFMVIRSEDLPGTSQYPHLNTTCKDEKTMKMRKIGPMGWGREGEYMSLATRWSKSLSVQVKQR